MNSNFVAHSFYEYMTGLSVRVYYDEGQTPWFMAKDIAEILEYSNTKQAILKNVDEEDKVQLENIGISNRLPSKTQAHSILINVSGLYSLIFRSKKKEAKKFKRWITSELLPRLRAGVCEIDEYRPMKSRLEVLELSSKILSIGGIEDRDKLLLKDLARNITLNSKSNQTEIIKANEEWSLSRRLHEKFDLRGNQVNKHLIQFGKIVLKVFIEKRGEFPPKREQFVGGNVRMVNCYFENDYIDFIDDLIIKYFNIDIEETEEETEEEDKILFN
jgi:prophage antirepressor-like protein